MKNIFAGLFTFLMLSSVMLAPAVAVAQVTGGTDKTIEGGLNNIKGAYPAKVTDTVEPESLAKRIITWALYIGALVAVIFIIIGGYFYLTSAGNEEQAKRGRRTLTYAIIGFVIMIFSWAIVQVVYRFLTS